MRDRLALMSARLREGIYPDSRAADAVLVAGPVDRISWDEAQALEYRPAEIGERFGPLWATYWFRVRVTVPEEWRGERADLLWVSRSEAALWRDGAIAQGLNTGGGGERPDAVLAATAVPGPIDVQIELACNGLMGAMDAPAELLRCDIARFDAGAWQLYFDFETLRALEAETRDEAWSGRLREELNRFCNEGDPDILSALYEHRNATHAHELAAIGHAHIDTAWLWPLAETYRKTLRSFSSQLRYMEDYPEYRFACSQAQQYAWIKERNPELWGRLRAAVERGQFVPVGGCWIEPDCNLPSGESLVRQFLHGQRWFEAEFGRRHREFWSPDAFGYAGQLPQIMREAGITRFLTQKLSWNRFNRPEHHTLVWQGDDGSEVLAHYPPADTYNSDVSVSELLKTSRDYKDHDHSGTSLLVFGFGDGGGGPTRDMLETLRRARDLQGLPRTTQRTSEEFFDALEAEAGDRPVVVGRALLRVPPRRLHVAGAHEAGQPPRRAGAPRRRVPRVPAAATIRAPSSTGCGSCSCCSSSTTSCRARRSASCMTTPSAISPRSRRARTRSPARGRRSSTRSGSRGARSSAKRLYRGRAVRGGASRRGRRRGPRRRPHARERPPARDALARGLGRVACCTRRAAARPSPRRATGSSSPRTARSTSRPGTSIPRRSRPGGLRARDVVERERRRRCVPRSRSSAPR